MSPLQMIALVAGVLFGLLAFTLWRMLRRRHPAQRLGLWIGGALLAGLSLLLLGLGDPQPAWPGSALVFCCLLGAMVLRILSLRAELLLPLRWELALPVWALSGMAYAAADWMPQEQGQVRLLLATLLLGGAALVFARHAVAVGQVLGSRIGHALAVADIALAAVLALHTAATLLHWMPSDDAGKGWLLMAAAALAVVAALFGNLGYLGLVLGRSRAAEQAASAVQWEERLRREAAEDRAASLRDLLHQRDELAAERDQLLKLLAHEIRQPLHNASGALQAARSVLVETGPDMLPRATERLLRAQGVLADVRSVLDNTLTAANLLGGGDALYMPDTPMLPLLQQALADLPDAQRRLVRVQWHDLPDTVELEAGLVRLALRNLLRNAFSHGGPAVSVLIQCERLAVPTAVAITVTDDGVGPPPDWQPSHDGDLPRRRGSPADGARTASRGLGLYIVQEVMARHGGSLSLRPRQPHGLVARLVFPQHSKAAAA